MNRQEMDNRGKEKGRLAYPAVNLLILLILSFHILLTLLFRS